MNSSSSAKSLTWPQIQTYLTFLKNHDSQIAKLISLKDDGVLEISEIEVKITKLLVQMHDTVVKVLNENGII
jgi:hypothetical protein